MQAPFVEQEDRPTFAKGYGGQAEDGRMSNPPLELRRINIEYPTPDVKVLCGRRLVPITKGLFF